MDLYKLSKNNKLEYLESSKFDLEKDIQFVIEQNTQELFNLQFVKSEFTVNGYRIDTLCFNQETNSFVIIEYKNNNSYSVIDQGYTYLSTMLNNKSDFVLEYNETMSSNLKRDEIDWSQSRVMFISPSFNKYQKDSMNFKDIPFELWEVKRFDGDLIGLNQLSNSSRESIKVVQKTKDKILDEVKVYDEDSIFLKSSEKVEDVFKEIKEKISSWNEVSFEITKSYVSVRRGNKNKIYLTPQRTQLKIEMVRRMDFKGNIESIPIKFTLDDPKNLFELFVDPYREIYKLSIENNKDIDYIVLMMKQKFDS
jgi:hypothetical protein